MTTRLNKLLVYLVLLGWLAGCNMPTRLGGTEVEGGEISDLPIAEPLPALNMTVINFQVDVPTDTPDEEIFLSVLDEVTGLALNPTYFSMQGIPAPAPGERKTYSVSLPVTMGTVIKYRYERQTSEGRVSEHLSDGQQVRYRMYAAAGPGTVMDIVSRWTDTPYQGPSGRITGKAVDAATGDPLPNILVTAGGGQVITSADGSFRIDGLPEGVHNLVAYSIDGALPAFPTGSTGGTRIIHRSAPAAGKRPVCERHLCGQGAREHTTHRSDPHGWKPSPAGEYICHAHRGRQQPGQRHASADPAAG